MKSFAFPSQSVLVLMIGIISLTFTIMLMLSGYDIKPVKSSSISQAPEGSQPIKVGVYVLNVGNLDISTGNYSMDFYLSFSCDKPCNTDTFDIMNGTIESQEKQTSNNRNGTFWIYRVQASLIANLDMHNYPFDEHRLVIAIEDKVNSTHHQYYVSDANITGVDLNAIVSGWDLKGSSGRWDAEVIDHPYPVFNNDTYSRYQFYITIYHPWQSSFLKSLFAPIVIVLLGLLAVLMGEDKISDRLSLTTSALIGAILYHLSAISSIPPIGYLTYMDKFMLVNYFIIACALTVTVVMMVYKDNNFDEQAKKLHIWTRALIPFVWIIMLVAITVAQFPLK